MREEIKNHQDNDAIKKSSDALFAGRTISIPVFKKKASKAEDDQAAEEEKESKRQAHIELFILTEDDVNKLLDNPDQLSQGRFYVKVKQGVDLYSGGLSADNPYFTKSKETISGELKAEQEGKTQAEKDQIKAKYEAWENAAQSVSVKNENILIAELTSREFIKVGTTDFYQIKDGEGNYCRVKKSDVEGEPFCQHDWRKIGFEIAEGSSDSHGYLTDKKTLKIFDELYEKIPREYQSFSGSYHTQKDFIDRVITNKKYEYYRRRIIGRHPTEWQGEDNSEFIKMLELLTRKKDEPEQLSTHLIGVIQKVLEDYPDIQRAKALFNHEEERIKKLSFWKDVPELATKQPYHINPIAFVGNALQDLSQIVFPLLVKPKNDKEGVWKNYYWAAALTDSNASQAIFGRNRGGGTRKHAARDLYTEALTEVVAICDGVVQFSSHYYYGTNQITVKHKTTDGRSFFIRYGEVDPESITVKVGDKVKQGDVIAKTGLMINPATNKHPSIITNEIVYMLHFEYYTGNGESAYPPNNTSNLPYKRRKDLADPLAILQEGYRSTFESTNEEIEDRIEINSLNLSEMGKEFIKSWEGFSSTAYDDSEGYCTIGYGHLIKKKKCEDIELSDEFKNGITKEKGDSLFESRISNYVTGLKKDVTVELYQYEFDALVSLLFNIGASGLSRKAPTLKRKLNNKDYEGAANEFLDITNGGTKGLVLRRNSESNLFLNNDYNSSH